jgi:lysozyme family protein
MLQGIDKKEQMMIKNYQILLSKKGYDVGVIDGIMGKKTREAIKAFQRDNHLVIDGIIGNKTLAILNQSQDKKAEIIIPWLEEMLRRVGLHENKNRDALNKWLATAGVKVDAQKTPWCGDAVETALLRSLGDIEIPDNPLLALNWTEFGILA